MTITNKDTCIEVIERLGSGTPTDVYEFLEKDNKKLQLSAIQKCLVRAFRDGTLIRAGLVRKYKHGQGSWLYKKNDQT